jgi:L-histidine N-alpha-methyltransferase
MALALPSIDVHLNAHDLHDQLAEDARQGLVAPEKWIPATWFYDEEGCRLFDEITELPEYYPTRTERSILAARADEIAAASAAATLVELGSGTSEKTGLIIDALERAGTLEQFVPFDVAGPTLSDAMDRLRATHPALSLHGVVGDFRRHLPQLLDASAGAARMIVFLGGTIGNLNRTERHDFFTTMRAGMTTDDTLLIGTDLVKAPERLVAAYDDSAGVTAAFNLNVLTVLNRELGGDIKIGDFSHHVVWNEMYGRIEMRLAAKESLAFHLDELDLTVFFAEGEELLTEISCKFTPDQIDDELTTGGFDVVDAWTDPAADFRLTLARPRH